MLVLGFFVCFFSFGLVYFLQTKILVLYTHMLNILFKICGMDHLNRIGSCNTGGGKNDSFEFTLLKCILYNRIICPNLGRLPKSDDAFVSCFFLNSANTC